MSFILDALRKSEHERQRQAGPVIANPYATPRRPPPIPPMGWIAGIAALLVVNIVVVLVLVLRDTPEPVAAPPAATQPGPTQAAPAAAAAAPVTEPGYETVTPDVSGAQDPIEAPAPAEFQAAESDAGLAETEESLPTLQELNDQGVAGLPVLRVDIHVYSRKPAERFVFINQRKYREGAQTAEGMTVEKITATGVVLDRNGLRFLLPRP